VYSLRTPMDTVPEAAVEPSCDGGPRWHAMTRCSKAVSRPLTWALHQGEWGREQTTLVRPSMSSLGTPLSALRSQVGRDGVVPAESKRHPPPVRPGLVPRLGLVARLSAAVEGPVVLAAPAGYGKSSLLAAWLEGEERPGASLSLQCATPCHPGFESDSRTHGLCAAQIHPRRAPRHSCGD
jgi:hypothetical protein